MKFQPSLDRGRLERRYKRFLADITLPSGETVTIHCPNTGSMKNCAEEGMTVWFSTSDNPKRKYSRTWELGETEAGHFLGINTTRANVLVEEAILNGVIQELQDYGEIRREVPYGEERSRIDLFLSEGLKPDCYVEIKSVTLLERSGEGFFPDAVSTRGQKHLRELMEVVASGQRGVLVFCVQHTGIKSVSVARHIDIKYGDLFREARRQGVEVYAYGCETNEHEHRITKALPVLD